MNKPSATSAPVFEMDTAQSLASDELAGAERAKDRRAQQQAATFRTASDVYAEASESASRNQQRPVSGDALYFDIETVPDWEREPLFGLEPLPEEKPETPIDKCPAISDLLNGTVKEIEKALGEINPPESYFDDLQAAEAAGKNRGGVEWAIKSARSAGSGNALQQRVKLLSVTPEFCRIVAISMAVGNHSPETFVLGHGEITEVDMLEAFWETVADASPVIGFNILHFDLPVILFRSSLLGVPSSRLIDTSPYRDQCVDLAVARFGRQIPKGFGMKNLARMCGIEVPAGDVDGGAVNDLWEAEEREQIAEYVASDVEVTRDLHRLWSGYFCV